MGNSSSSRIVAENPGMSTTSVDTAYFNPTENNLSCWRLLDPTTDIGEPIPWTKKQIAAYYVLAEASYSSKLFHDAYRTTAPLVTPPDLNDRDMEHGELIAKAPVGGAGKKLRVKVWILHFKLLDTIIQLERYGDEEGFTRDEWREATSKVVNGTIWDHVYLHGYGGNYAKMDSLVVLQLYVYHYFGRYQALTCRWYRAELVYSYARSQKSNQRHLESYLAAALQPSQSPSSSPNELLRQKSILQLLTTAVLPANGEGDYARTLISSSDILTEEEQETLRQELDDAEAETRAEQGGQAVLSTEQMDLEEEPQDQEMEEADPDTMDVDEEAVLTASPKSAHHGHDSEKDFGIEDPQPSAALPQPMPKSSLKPSPVPVQHRAANSSPTEASKHSTTSTGLVKRSAAIMGNFQRLINSIIQTASRNPMGLLRFVLFLVGVVVALSRRDVKEKLRQAWAKVQRTVGMGVKVSYI